MRKILVIEDEPEMRRNISALLRYCDYESIAAENGRRMISEKIFILRDRKVAA